MHPSLSREAISRLVRTISGRDHFIAKTGWQSNSAPFAIPARESYLVFVTSEEHVREVESSPQDQLSFHKAMEDVCDHRSV